MQVLWNTW